MNKPNPFAKAPKGKEPSGNPFAKGGKKDMPKDGKAKGNPFAKGGKKC